jgi:hypothetical protein
LFDGIKTSLSDLVKNFENKKHSANYILCRAISYKLFNSINGDIASTQKVFPIFYLLECTSPSIVRPLILFAMTKVALDNRGYFKIYLIYVIIHGIVAIKSWRILIIDSTCLNKMCDEVLCMIPE